MITKDLPQYNPKGESEDITLRDLILRFIDWYRYLLSKWVVILIAGIFGCILGLTYGFFKKTIYTASSTFVLEEPDKAGGMGLGQYAGLASMVGIDINGGGGLFQGDNIIELYKSRSMLQKTLLTIVDIDGKKRMLIDKYIEIKGLRKKWENDPKLRSIEFSLKPAQGYNRIQDSILGKVADDINKMDLLIIKPDKKLSIIKVDVKSNDELFAKLFNDQIVKNVNDFYIQTKTKKSLENLAILQNQTDSVRLVMTKSIYGAAAVVDATPNMNPSRQIQRTAPMQRLQFSAETNKAVLAELVKNLEMSKIALRKETPLIQIIDEPILPLKSTKSNFLLFAFSGALLSMLMVGAFFSLKMILSDILKDSNSSPAI